MVGQLSRASLTASTCRGSGGSAGRSSSAALSTLALTAAGPGVAAAVIVIRSALDGGHADDAERNARQNVSQSGSLNHEELLTYIEGRH